MGARKQRGLKRTVKIDYLCLREIDLIFNQLHYIPQLIRYFRSCVFYQKFLIDACCYQKSYSTKSCYRYGMSVTGDDGYVPLKSTIPSLFIPLWLATEHDLPPDSQAWTAYHSEEHEFILGFWWGWRVSSIFVCCFVEHRLIYCAFSFSSYNCLSFDL